MATKAKPRRGQRTANNQASKQMGQLMNAKVAKSDSMKQKKKTTYK